jgi:hypothetical protein
MAEQTQAKDQAESTENGGVTNGGHKGAIRAAAVAAATGAAALAAKKAFSGRDQSGEGKEKSSSRRSGGGADESMLVAMAGSGWSAAKDSLLPFAEDAAGAAGEWIGRNGPDYVIETIVPRFISGFESARESSQASE